MPIRQQTRAGQGFVKWLCQLLAFAGTAFVPRACCKAHWIRLQRTWLLFYTIPFSRLRLLIQKMHFFPNRLAFACRLLWAAPCSLLGLLLGAVLLALGGQCQRVQHTLEFSRFCTAPAPDSLWARLPWQGITFGHVILGVCAPTLQALRSHEHVHVRQYECWGVFFLIAYPLASLFALLAGQRPYRDNVFERAAYDQQDKA